MSRRVWFSLTLLFVTLALVSRAPAAPVHYQESVSGDLPERDPVPLFTLDVGVNTVSGTCSTNGPLQGVFDSDSFAFIIPDGLSVTTAMLSVPSVSHMTELGWYLLPGTGSTGNLPVLENFFTSTPGSYTAKTTPLHAGAYNFFEWDLGGSTSFLNTANYTFTLTVTAVPEPASLGLLAMTGFVLCTRRASK